MAGATTETRQAVVGGGGLNCKTAASEAFESTHVPQKSGQEATPTGDSKHTIGSVMVSFDRLLYVSAARREGRGLGVRGSFVYRWAVWVRTDTGTRRRSDGPPE